MERTRKVDINNLSEEQFKSIEENLKKEVSKRIDTAVEDINRYLNVYGLEILLGVRVVKQGEANLIKGSEA
jgi:hypothetical protein